MSSRSRDEGFVENGYIRVYQDVRGKYGSEGPYLMTPLPVDSGFNSTGADDTTDAWDTIDWLIKNVPETNGRVGMIGSSYEGFTVVMALLHPHPALKVAAPESPMVDGWMGDDWFHYGAFRQPNIDYVIGQMTARGNGIGCAAHRRRLHELSPRRLGRRHGARRRQAPDLPFMRILEEHQAYDAFWQAGALDKLIAKLPLTVPTMWEQGLYDQEDMWGAIHSYRALQGKANAEQHELPGDGTVVPLADQSPGPRIGAVRLGDRHGEPVAPRRDGAVLQPISKGRCAESRHASGVGV